MRLVSIQGGDMRHWILSVILALTLTSGASSEDKQVDEAWLVYPPEIIGKVMLEGNEVSAVIMNFTVASPRITCKQFKKNTRCTQRREILQVAILENFEYTEEVPADFDPKKGVTTRDQLIREDVARLLLLNANAK